MLRACCAVLFLLLVTISSPSFAAENSTTSSQHQLFDREWEYQMEHNPVRASTLGDRRWNDKWSDLSLEAMREQFAHVREVLKDLHGIDRSQLSAEDQLSYDGFDYNVSDFAEGEQYKWYLIRTNAFSGMRAPL